MAGGLSEISRTPLTINTDKVGYGAIVAGLDIIGKITGGQLAHLTMVVQTLAADALPFAGVGTVAVSLIRFVSTGSQRYILLLNYSAVITAFRERSFLSSTRTLPSSELTYNLSPKVAIKLSLSTLCSDCAVSINSSSKRARR